MTGSSEPACVRLLFSAKEKPKKTTPSRSRFNWQDEGMKGVRGEERGGQGGGLTYESLPGNELSFKGSMECGKDGDTAES